MMADKENRTDWIGWEWVHGFLKEEEYRRLWDRVQTNPNPGEIHQLERLFADYVTGLRWRSYCARRLRRRARDFLAQERRRFHRQLLLWDHPLGEDGNTWGDGYPDRSLTVEEHLQDGWEHPGLAEGWVQLTPRQQRILHHYYQKGDTDGIIARKYGISQQAVNRSRIRALRKLRQCAQNKEW
jgi:RNA polymerase sigma factor (sigma-70 family)